MHPVQCKVFIVPPEQLQAHMLNALNKQETNVLVAQVKTAITIR